MDEENELMYENNFSDDLIMLVAGGYSIVISRDAETSDVTVRAKNLETDTGISMTLGVEGVEEF